MVTGDEIAARARVFFDTAPPEDTQVLTQTIDAAAPVTTLAVNPIGTSTSNFNIDWRVVDDAGGSGFRHVTIYVAENGGDFRIWQRQRTEATGSETFIGSAGTAYEFLALATDVAGNRESPPAGLLAPDDGSGINLGFLTELEQTAPNYGIPPPSVPDPSTNAVFTAAEFGEPSTLPPVRLPEWNSVVLPFEARSFATGIGQSESFIGPLAIAETPDGNFLISGGANRNEIFVGGEDGGEVGAPLAALPYPIFNLAFDGNGGLWATTAGGPLLELDPSTGAILAEHGQGITMGLAVDPASGDLFVGSSRGVERFDPASGIFTRFSRDLDLRVSSLAFDEAGDLWAVAWPERAEVVKFNERARVETQLEFESEIDSIAFGQAGTRLAGLLFVTHVSGDIPNSGGVEPDNSVVTMVDLVTLRTIEVAQGGSRGDVAFATSDGRILVSQTNQVDELKPAEPPVVLFTIPTDGSDNQLPLPTATIVFDRNMFVGNGSESGSVLNPANYSIVGDVVGALGIDNVAYDLDTFTVTLDLSGAAIDSYTLTVFDTVQSLQRLHLEGDFVANFTISFVGEKPVAGDNIAITNEDTPVLINVLGNDQDADGTVNPATITIDDAPDHGSVVINLATGFIEYSPALNYSGPDTFTYTVADNEGNVSDPATVRVTVIPVADDPTTVGMPTSGMQDTEIPVDVFAALTDTDGSETLMVEISNVPAGATPVGGARPGRRSLRGFCRARGWRVRPWLRRVVPISLPGGPCRALHA